MRQTQSTLYLFIALVAAVIIISFWWGAPPDDGATAPPSTITTGIKDHALPDPRLAPGAIDARVTQGNIKETICVRGYTRTIRPPSNYTSHLKRRQLDERGYADTNMRDYEEDHLIPLELGGNPTDPRNLWPEPWNGPEGAHVKDKLENRLHEMVCAGEIPLAIAQQAIAKDWASAYRMYVGANDDH